MATVEGQQANSNSVLEIKRFCVCFVCVFWTHWSPCNTLPFLAQGLSCHTSDVHSSLSQCIRDAKVLADHFQDKLQHTVYQGLSSINPSALALGTLQGHHIKILYYHKVSVPFGDKIPLAVGLPPPPYEGRLYQMCHNVLRAEKMIKIMINMMVKRIC